MIFIQQEKKCGFTGLSVLVSLLGGSFAVGVVERELLGMVEVVGLDCEKR